MKNSLAAGIAILWLAPVSAASAADILVKAPTPTPTSAFGWSGAYIGVNGGYGGGDPRSTLSGDLDQGGGSGVVNSLFNLDSIHDNTVPLSNNKSGAFGGLQIGINWQPDPKWLIGIETDIQISAVKGSATVTAPPGSPSSAVFSLSSNPGLPWFGTLRGRFGFLLTDQLLVFGTGGLAYGETSASSVITDIGNGLSTGLPTVLTCNPAVVCLAGSQSRLSAGWAAGGGVEFAAWRNVTFKLEYLHIDLGPQNLTLTVQAPSTGNGFAVEHFANSFDMVRAGVNYRF